MPRIDLDRPARVDGAAAPAQSLWLLLALWRRAQGPGPTLDVATLDRHLPPARHARMRISRAFADFARWGVRVGWGVDRSVPFALLPLAERSRGPFWLAAGEARRLRVFIDGKTAAPADVDRWLRWSDDAPSPSGVASPGRGLAYWNAWVEACDASHARQWIVDGRHGALAALRRAEAQAATPSASAFVHLQQAMTWRRAGNADAARRVLDAIPARVLSNPAHGDAWLGAMAAIVRAWGAYTDRDLAGARRLLHRAYREPAWQPVFEHHPRVRAEHANLLALLERADALDESRDGATRTGSARAALAHYREAFTVASEAELGEAAASAASNLGWSLWLFRRTGLVLDDAESPWPWLALGARQVESSAVPGGQWGTLYVLRMVRDGGPAEALASRAALRAWPVLAPSELASACAPVASPWSGHSWLPRVRSEVAAIDAGRVQVDPRLRANLLLELAWYEAREGDLRQAAAAAARLRHRLRELAPRDRPFFRQALKRLPPLGSATAAAG
jgi:hypothetical protein